MKNKITTRVASNQRYAIRNTQNKHIDVVRFDPKEGSEGAGQAQGPGDRDCWPNLAVVLLGRDLVEMQMAAA